MGVALLQLQHEVAHEEAEEDAPQGLPVRIRDPPQRLLPVLPVEDVSPRHPGGLDAELLMDDADMAYGLPPVGVEMAAQQLAQMICL